MNRRIYSLIIRGTLIIIISYALFFFIYSFIKMGKTQTITENVKFDVTTILNISKNRITLECETYNSEDFIEYDCVIDGIHCIRIVRVGKVANAKLSDCLYFVKQAFPSRAGWFNHDIASPASLPFFNFIIPNIASYNVFLLPLKEVDKVNVFVDGKIINKEYVNDTIVSYFVESYGITFAFNDINKNDLEFSYVNVPNPTPTPANMFFTIDADKNLYIGCTSTTTNTPKTLKEILDNEEK